MSAILICALIVPPRGGECNVGAGAAYNMEPPLEQGWRRRRGAIRRKRGGDEIKVEKNPVFPSLSF
jgi:hypothetical protein